MGALIKYGTGDLTNINDYIKVTYPMLSGIASSKLWKPTVKRYLYTQVRTPFSTIHPSDWQISVFLPTAKWVRGAAYKKNPYTFNTGSGGKGGTFRA